MNEEDWEISTEFTKGVVSGGRGVVVVVRHLPTGRTVRESRRASTKANARIVASELVSKLVSEIQSKLKK